MKNENILEYHSSKRHRGAYYSGSTQRAISARIDHEVICELDLECAASGQTRNGVINKAVHWYLRELDDARRLHCSNVYTGDADASYSHERLFTNRLTCQQLSKLHHICASLNVSVDELVERLLERLLESYDDRPMLYL